MSNFDTTFVPAEGSLPKTEPMGSAADYIARSEGVRSSGTLALAHRLLSDPTEATPDLVQKLAAAVLTFRLYGK